MPLQTVKIHEIVAAEARLEVVPRDDPFRHSYREFLAFFAQKTALSANDVTIGAYASYGWMPTMLKRFGVQGLQGVVDIANRIKAGSFPTEDDMTALVGVMNNSIVGASKLLHFINPRICAIWDSRIFRFIQGREWTDAERRDQRNYFAYHKQLERLTSHPAFRPVHQSINGKIGYVVTRYRACEYTMHEAADH
jgi:hypothetical protein